MRYGIYHLWQELFTRNGTANSSGAYQGPLYFTFNGTKLTELPVSQIE